MRQVPRRWDEDVVVGEDLGLLAVEVGETVRDGERKKKVERVRWATVKGFFCRSRRRACRIEAAVQKAWRRRVGVHVAVELYDASRTDAH
jgi:hypothetical protein